MNYFTMKVPIVLSILMIGCTDQNEITQNNTQADNMLPISNQDSDDKLQSMPINLPKNTENKTTANKKQELQQEMKQKVMLDVPLIRQNPELKYGCEVTSLTMVLQYAGIRVDKMTLANELEKDIDPVIRDRYGNIIRWGNPDDGFVGDITGKHLGYAVFDKPMERLMKKYMPNRTLNLTNKPFKQILAQVNDGKPVLVWTTGDYRLPDRWESWKHGNKTIKTPLDLHAVVLVGYDKDHVYLNDPLSGKKSVKVKKTNFIKSWEALKKRALSYN
jgi:uncharacterized protein YvpB